MVRIFLFLSLLFSASTQSYGSGGEEKKSDGHGGGHGGGHEEAPPEPPKPKGPSRKYNPGKIIAFPSFEGDVVGQGTPLSFKPRQGHATMIIFIASWCEPCQLLMPDLKQLARKYSALNTDVFFIFAHDTKPDATGFAKEHQLSSPAIMANMELLKVFKNPELPSVYIGDKWGYMADRFINTKKSDIDRIDNMMGKITAL